MEQGRHVALAARCWSISVYKSSQHGSRDWMNRNDEQKLANRQLMLAAALLTFKEESYYETSVEDIIIRAKISRKTFYKHFRSKLSVAEALVEQLTSELDSAYDKLGAIQSPNASDIIGWLNLVMDIFESNKLLFAVLAELFAAEPRLKDIARIENTKRIRRLSKSIRAFRGALSTTDRGAEARDCALLLLQEIDNTLFGLIVREWDIDRDVAIRFLARQIQNFIECFSVEEPERTLESAKDPSDKDSVSKI
jgi:AcrR family transcriptional regulator